MEKNTMKCILCSYAKPLKAKSVTHHYKECGLDNVVLYGVLVYVCPSCGEEYFQFGDLKKLHGLIAKFLILKKAPLTGSEIRFLRTCLGYSNRDFSKLIGCKKETLSRIENGKQKTSLQLDRLVRLLTVGLFSDLKTNLPSLWLNDEAASIKKIKFKAGKQGWVEAA